MRVAKPYRNALILLLATGLALPVPGLTAPSPANRNASPHVAGIALAEREQRLTQTLTAIADMRQALDRSEFDAEALLESLDYDPQAIIEFVRDEIRFEPYEGLLRGVQGTLMSRAGNALDQSLLLAFLLSAAGADARLAHGTLSDEQALALVRSLRGQPRPSATPLPDLQPHIRKIAQAAAQGDALGDTAIALLNGLPPPQDQPIWAAAEMGRDYLQHHLSQAGIALKPGDAEPLLAAQSRRYFWVEYKDAIAEPWQRIHAIPAGDALDEQALATEAYLEGDIPERFQHRLRLSAKLERQAGGKTEIVEIMQPWERPAANMIDKRLTFSNLPNGLGSPDALNDLSLVEASTTLLIPTFNDAPAPGAQAFDLRGRTIAFDTLQMGRAGAVELFQTMSDKSLAAADALSGLSFDKPGEEPATSALSLRRVWLEYTSIHPDGSERVDERTIWQAPAIFSEMPASTLWELATPHGIGVAVSEYPASYLLDTELARLQSTEPLLRWALLAQATPPGQPLPPQPPAPAEFPELSYLSQFDLGIDPDADALLAYRAEPSIVVTRHGLRNANGQAIGYSDVDIMHNRRTVLRTDASSVQTAPLQAMRLGAWDTLIEQLELERRLPLLFSAHAQVSTLSANQMYQDPDRRSQTPLILQDGKDLAALPANSLEEAGRLALARDLQRGYVLAMEAPAPSQPLVWWRTDPYSGETLGMGTDGRGQITKEHVMMVTLIGIKTSVVIGTTICTASSECNFTQCLATAAITTGGTVAVGTVLGMGGIVGGLLASAVGVMTHTGFSQIEGVPALPTCLAQP